MKVVVSNKFSGKGKALSYTSPHVLSQLISVLETKHAPQTVIERMYHVRDTHEEFLKESKNEFY